jgi:integrase
MLAHLGVRETRRRAVSLKTDRTEPDVLTDRQIDRILEACGRLRDRFLFSVLRESGCGSVRCWGCGTRI